MRRVEEVKTELALDLGASSGWRLVARSVLGTVLLDRLKKKIVKFNARTHRDKTRVQVPAKMFPRLKLLCWLFMGPTLGFDTKQRNSFLIKFGGFFYNKSKNLTILFIVKYEKITLFDELLFTVVIYEFP